VKKQTDAGQYGKTQGCERNRQTDKQTDRHSSSLLPHAALAAHMVLYIFCTNNMCCAGERIRVHACTRRTRSRSRRRSGVHSSWSAKGSCGSRLRQCSSRASSRTRLAGCNLRCRAVQGVRGGSQRLAFGFAGLRRRGFAHAAAGAVIGGIDGGLAARGGWGEAVAAAVCAVKVVVAVVRRRGRRR
jgi:hypothetical protein